MSWVSLAEKFGQFAREVLALVKTTEKNQKDIEELQSQLRELNDVLREVLHQTVREIQRYREVETLEQQKQDLKVEKFKSEIETSILRAQLAETIVDSDPEKKKRSE